jgi:hypothetical protein
MEVKSESAKHSVPGKVTHAVCGVSVVRFETLQNSRLLREDVASGSTLREALNGFHLFDCTLVILIFVLRLSCIHTHFHSKRTYATEEARFTVIHQDLRSKRRCQTRLRHKRGVEQC